MREGHAWIRLVAALFMMICETTDREGFDDGGTVGYVTCAAIVEGKMTRFGRAWDTRSGLHGY